MPTLQFSEDTALPQPVQGRKQLLVHIIDGIAQVRPESVWAKIPKSLSTYDAGYRKVTYKLLGNAINGMAWWIKNQLGESEAFETLAYFGPWDPRYIITLLGAVKTGYKMVFPSPGYASAGLLHILDQLDCNTILTSATEVNVISKFPAETHRSFLEIPSLEDLLDKEYPHFPYNKTFETARSEPLVVVHTSGTTGVPKPLVYTHDWVASWNEQIQLLPPDEYTSLEYTCHGVEVCAVMPANHSSGFFPNLFAAIPNQIVVIFPLPSAAVTFETAMQMIRWNSPDLLLAPAHVLDALAANTEALKEVSEKVSMIAFGGGPLSKVTGEILTKHFRVYGMYGTSEMGTVPKILPNMPWNRKSWNSWKPHPKANMQFRYVQDDNFEAVIVRNPEGGEEQPVFKLFPKLQEWPTRDVFSPDPHRDGFWSYRGRVDDLIILSSGGTVNPSGYEEKISRLPFVKSVVMCGTGRQQPALIVEFLDASNSQNFDVMEDLLKDIDQCNGVFPPQAFIARSHIILASSQKPVPRSAKGTIQRANTLELYEKELGEVYQGMGKKI